MSTETALVAADLQNWFQSVQHLAVERHFSIAPPGPHRDAVILNILMSNARLLTTNPIDNGGRLYSPLCFFLTAAVEKLHQTLRVGHWRVAVENVLRLEAQLQRLAPQSERVGLGGVRAVDTFKEQLDQTLSAAGLTANSTYLDKDNREVALGLAVHWGIRFLLAYAIHCGPRDVNPTQQNLSWIADLMATGASTSCDPA